MTTTAMKSTAKTAVTDEREPLMLEKRIGSTTFVVSVRFRDEATETLEQKLLRLIESEAQND